MHVHFGLPSPTVKEYSPLTTIFVSMLFMGVQHVGNMLTSYCFKNRALLKKPSVSLLYQEVGSRCVEKVAQYYDLKHWKAKLIHWHMQCVSFFKLNSLLICFFVQISNSEWLSVSQEWFRWSFSTCWFLELASGLLSRLKGRRSKVGLTKWTWPYWGTAASRKWWGLSQWQVRWGITL